MTTSATLYCTLDCATCSRYGDLLAAAGMSYSTVDISDAASHDDTLGTIDRPTIVFTTASGGTTRLIEPTSDELQRSLERLGVTDRTIHHDPVGDGSGQYVLPLEGEDAFIDYVDHGDVRHITYSQVPSDRRGQGLGAELSHKTLDALIEEGRSATFGCGYVGAIAARYRPWQTFIGAATEDQDA